MKCKHKWVDPSNEVVNASRVRVPPLLLLY